MARTYCGIGALVVVVAILASSVYVRAAENEGEPDRLAVLWTSGDPDVAHRVCFMDTHAPKKSRWFDEVRLIVWGPSQRLLVGDKDIKAKVKSMQEDGVVVEACIACATSYGLVDTIRDLGIEVKPMGPPLAGFLKDGYKVLTF